MWSQYLEVAIGPDAEVFTKAPVLSTVGWGADIGVRSDSNWNNPEPEVVLAVDAAGTVVGATLGNDVNLRDFEGRSALLLGKAKDNNAACSIGAFVRLFDSGFTIDDVRNAELDLVIEGPEGYRLEGHSSMRQISRDPLELVRQTLSEHQYPDGFVLFLGTLFAPVQDRDAPGRGFTHKVGDVVRIHSQRLGTLVNRVTTSADAPPWRYGIRDLYRSLGRARFGSDGVTSDRAIYPSLAGKHVLVTGGGSGIGAGIVEGFVRQGAQVAFFDVAEADSRALVERLRVGGGQVRFERIDLTDIPALQGAIAGLIDEDGGFDILVNNAANDDRHTIDDVTEAYWNERLSVNLKHMVFCAKAVVPAMRAKGAGAIVNLGSISWHLGLSDLILYQTCKAAVEGMTRSLARDLGRAGIRATCVVPGNVRTPRQLQWYTPEGEAEIVAAQCLDGRLMPEDVAALVMFLASDDARLITGHSYFVDGGWR